jgi:alpha-amylase
MIQHPSFRGAFWALSVSLLYVVGCSAQPESTPQPVEMGRGVAASDPGVMVHLFEWRWDDVATECSEFIGPAGYRAVQVSPPTESAIVDGRPWYEKYQPVSYMLDNRSGDREAFGKMVSTCRDAGVDIVVDVILNHMTGVYEGVGSAGSRFSEYEYPGIYSYDDFHHCGTEGDEIQDWNDPVQLRECELVNLADLKTESAHIRTRLADYLKDLASLGVAGIRIDAARHVYPEDIQAILQEAEWSGYVVQEVADGAREGRIQAEYLGNGSVTEFRYGWSMAPEMRSGRLDRLHGEGSIWDQNVWVPSDKALVFVDNHDTQRKPDVITYKDGALYDLAQVFTLAYPYGKVRVMSSFEFEEERQGPPTTDGDTIAPVHLNGELNCEKGEWVCEHRRPAIVGAMQFRAATAGAESVTHWWTNGSSQIAFGRGDRGFVILNASTDELQGVFDTGMPEGEYCDRLSGPECSPISIASGGKLTLNIEPMSAMAIDVGIAR